MELTADFRTLSGDLVFSTRAEGFAMTEFPKIGAPEPWQTPEEIYAVETAMMRAEEPVRFKPKKLTLTFAILSQDPRVWFSKVSGIRHKLHGKRLRCTFLTRVPYLDEHGRPAAHETPLASNTFPEEGVPTEREMYYEGVVTVGDLEVSDRKARITVSMLADPWLYTQWRSETLAVDATAVDGAGNVTRTGAVEWNTAEAPKLTEPYCTAMRFWSEHTEGTRDAETGVIGNESIASRYRLRVWWTGGPRVSYPLFIEKGTDFYDSGIGADAARSFAVVSGEVDFDAADKSFTVLPMDLTASGLLAFTGRGTVTLQWREGRPI